MWLYLLKNTVGLKTCPPEITGRIFKLFLQISEKNQLTPTEMDRYAVSLERSYQMRDVANYARMEGKLEGKQEGKQEGMMEKSIQFAIKLLMRNETIEEVVALTDLSREQVQSLRNQLPKA